MKRIQDGTQIKHQPVIQLVEDGVKIALSAKAQNEKIQIQGDVLFSQVLGVETFTYPYPVKQDGSTINIQVPEHQVRWVHWSTTIESDQTILIDPIETMEKQIRPKSKFKNAIHQTMRRLILVTPILVETDK